MSLLNKAPKEQLEVFLSRYAEIREGLDIDEARRLIKETVKYYSSKKGERDELVHLQTMENQWYKALDEGHIDYSVYDHKHYLTDLWACWVLYSRAYLRALVNPNSLEKGKSIHSIMTGVEGVLDLGCGIGYTSRALAEMFPDAEVYGTNIEGTEQYRFCQRMVQNDECSLVSKPTEIWDKIDLVFASEYFEHIINPLGHLQDIVNEHEPKFFVIANAFNTRSIGHFHEYYNEEYELIPEKDISRLFNKKMRSLGYKKLKTRIFNDRPTIWVRDES